jgi:hypothetical protein
MRCTVRGLVLGLGTLGLAVGSASAQSVISAHAGIVQYVEGRAYLNDKVVEPKFGQFPDIKENQEFRTEEGRAEILLTPGVFLRLGENSSIKMVSNHLTNTKFEVLTGSAVVECNDVPKDNSIEAIYKGSSIRLDKQGLYRIDTNPARVRVYEGEAVVTDGSGQLRLKAGKQSNLDGVLLAESFDRKDTDSLYSWSDRRAAYVAQANIVSANTVNNGGYSGYGGYGLYNGFGGYNTAFLGGSYLGGWAFNPSFGMYTYLPYSGFGYSPFGYTYFSPYTVGYAPYYGSGGGYTGTGRVSRISGIAGGSRMASAPSSGRGGSSESFGRGGFFGSSTGSARMSSGGGGSISMGGGGGARMSSGGGGGGHAGGGHH